MSIKYENGSVQTLISAGLNSLADDAGALSSAYDNGAAAALYMWGQFELYVAGFGAAPTADELVEMYFQTAIDGSNFADGAAGSPPTDVNNTHFVAAFAVRNDSGAQRITLPNAIAIPSEQFKVMIINRTGQSFAASGNTLKMLPVRLQ